MSSKARPDLRKKPGPRLSRVVTPVRDEVRLGRRNWILFGVGLGVIALGYILLSQGSITLAPILLVGGYCVLLPWAILASDRPGEVDAGRSGPPKEGGKS